MFTVGVRFKGYGVDNRTYHYLSKYPVTEDQVLIVETPAHGFQIVALVSCQEGVSNKATKYLAGCWDPCYYQAEEAKRIEVKLIQSEMAVRRKVVEKQMLVEALVNDTEYQLLDKKLMMLLK